MVNLAAKFEVSNYDRCRDMEGVPNFTFPSLVPLVVNLHAKFEVYSSNRSRDIQKVPKFEK